MHTIAALLLIWSHLVPAATAVRLPVEGGERPHPRCRNMNTSAGSEKLLAAVAADASASTRTITVPIEDGWTDIGLQVDATRVAYTAITVTATCSRNHGTSYGNLNTVEPAGSGGLNVYTATWTKTTSSTTNETFDFDASKCDYMKFVVGLTTGGTTDLMDAYVKVCSI
jgi:hypothetical protein